MEMMMSSRRNDPSLSFAKAASSFRKADGNDVSIDRDFVFPQPNTPVANDDDYYFREYRRSTPRVTLKKSNLLDKLVISTFFCLSIVLGLASILVPNAFLDIGITPTLILVSIIPIAILLLLTIVLFRINKISQVMEKGSIASQNDTHFLSIHSKLEEFNGDILSIKQDALLCQTLLSTSIKAIELHFENALNANSERLSDIIFNVNSTTYSTAKLIDDRLDHIMSLLGGLNNSETFKDDVIARQTAMALQISNIDKQVKVLADKISQKFYDTGSNKDEFEKLMNSYLDRINQRSDLVVAQLDQAVSRSQDLLEKIKLNRQIPDIAAAQQKLETDFLTIEKRLSESISRAEDFLDIGRKQSQEYSSDFSNFRRNGSSSQGMHDIEGDISKIPIKLNTKSIIDALENNAMDSEISKYFSNEPIERDVVKNISSNIKMNEKNADDINGHENMKKIHPNPSDGIASDRNNKKLTSRRSESILRKMFRL